MSETTTAICETCGHQIAWDDTRPVECNRCRDKREREADQAAIRALDDSLNELVANDFVAAWISQQIAELQTKHAAAIQRAQDAKG